jgi:hypothetical protein
VRQQHRLRLSVEEVADDLSGLHAVLEQLPKGYRLLISDHRPLWAQFRI